MKTRLVILSGLFFVQLSAKAQMKIGDHPTTINSASLLELESTNKGFVFPSVSLNNVTSAAPLPTGLLTGTVVYNINGSITGGNGTGLYIWNGTLWMLLSTGSASSTAWSLTGNSGTNYSTNFLGTTDNLSLRIRTNNIQRILADSVGAGLRFVGCSAVGIGSCCRNGRVAGLPVKVVHIAGSGGGGGVGAT